MSVLFLCYFVLYVCSSRQKTARHVITSDTLNSSNGVIGESEENAATSRFRKIEDDDSIEKNILRDDLKDPIKDHCIFHNPGFQQSTDV